jgi:hypothetical protein|uniref:Uncharacterized protein n=1 Tax=viral metagenome TaxID=1070528 RepID=A0A6C0BS42_9ZZZZ
MSQNLSIYDIHNEINRRKETKTHCYRKVLEVCENKIRTASEKEIFKIYIDVPEYIIGLPIYDISECIKYVSTHLTRNGFLVEYFFPKILYVSWDLDEINKKEISIQQLTTGKYKTLPSNHESIKETDKMLLSSRASHFIENHDLKKNKTIDSSNKLQYRPNGKFILNLD